MPGEDVARPRQPFEASRSAPVRPGEQSGAIIHDWKAIMIAQWHSLPEALDTVRFGHII